MPMRSSKGKFARIVYKIFQINHVIRASHVATQLQNYWWLLRTVPHIALKFMCELYT